MEATGRKQPIDYLTDMVNATAGGIGQAVGFISLQTRERPLVVGSVIAGSVGAMVGARIAQMQAIQRRRSLFTKVRESLASVSKCISSWVSPRPKTPIEMLQERGREISRGLGAISVGARPQREVSKGAETAIRQVGYALSLIPITMELARNPLLRSMAFRLLARRARAR